MGSMYVFMIFTGISSCSSVLPFVSTQRTIVYRERFSRMYSSWAYSLAQVIIEIPYIFLEAVLFLTITYPAVNFYGSAYKQFPKWWVWGYWISPSSWSLKGLLTSQYGDIEEEIMAFGEQKALNTFLDSRYGYKHRDLPIIAVVLLAFPLVFASVFTY
ncbi:hypothetical protein Golax_014003, partial [Gossypium laxum]|nr:hypothetical protein [Gossypium laxum]